MKQQEQCVAASCKGSSVHAAKNSILTGGNGEKADCAALSRRYYVRMDGACPFPANKVGENAYLTEPVPVDQMHETMKEIPGAFFAAWAEE